LEGSSLRKLKRDSVLQDTDEAVETGFAAKEKRMRSFEREIFQ
jgi:hypothetical protein